MNIPPPPLWQSLLFENPWPDVIVLVGLASILYLLGKGRHSPRLKKAAAIVLILSASLFALASLVTTAREALIARTRQLVQATSPLKLDVLDAAIPADTPIYTAGHHLLGRFGNLKNRLQQLPMISQQVIHVTAQGSGGRGLSRVSLKTLILPGQPPFRSAWALRWRYGNHEHWRVTSIYWLSWQGRTPPLSLPGMLRALQRP